MASLANDQFRRYDTRRRKEAAEETAVSEDEVEDPLPRGFNHFEFHGPVTISSGFNRGQQSRYSGRRNPSSAAREITGRVPSLRKQSEARCDSQSDEPSQCEDDPADGSDDRASYKDTRKSTKLRLSGERYPAEASRQPKRHQTDEGYDTGGKGSIASGPSTRSTKSRGKGKASASPTRHARLSTAVKHRKRQVSESENEASEGDLNPERDDDLLKGQASAEEETHDDEEDASDDDFGKLAVVICSKDFSKSKDEKAILDTGTKTDWISATFYDELKSSGIQAERIRLNAEESKIEYKDFNNNKFAPTSKVELIVKCDEFAGPLNMLKLSFCVSSKATFSILLGRGTIRKHKLLTKGKPDSNGESAFVGVRGPNTEEEQAAVKKKREEQSQVKEERKKQRDAKLHETLNTNKAKAKASTSQGAAHLATMVIRSSRPRSPHQGVKRATKNVERQSDSSLEGTW